MQVTKHPKVRKNDENNKITPTCSGQVLSNRKPCKKNRQFGKSGGNPPKSHVFIFRHSLTDHKHVEKLKTTDTVAFVSILGSVKRKSAFQRAQDSQIQIVLHIRKVSLRPLLSIYTFCSIQRFC